jgi:hypothetical protein
MINKKLGLSPRTSGSCNPAYLVVVAWQGAVARLCSAEDAWGMGTEGRGPWGVRVGTVGARGGRADRMGGWRADGAGRVGDGVDL